MWSRERVDDYWNGLIVTPAPAREDVEGYFSWSPCESCGSHLGGDRYDVAWWSEDDSGDEGTGSVCVDCYCYIANGDIPEEAQA